jgi:exosortase F-associated protein
MKLFIKFAISLILVLLLALIRYFENILFYDPLLNYFEQEYLTENLPHFDNYKYFWNLFLRYFLNTSLSVFFILLFFPGKNTTYFLIKFYAIAFLILITAFFIISNWQLNNQTLVLFYLRRFLIQPIFILILLPAFYYQKVQLLNKQF